LQNSSNSNLSYDDDGNLTCDGMWNYSWDAENRLAVMETTTVARTYGGIPPFRIAFKYDALGRRIQKSVTRGRLYYGNPIYLNPRKGNKITSKRKP
jgi:hypothetical protein